MHAREVLHLLFDKEHIHTEVGGNGVEFCLKKMDGIYNRAMNIDFVHSELKFMGYYLKLQSIEEFLPDQNKGSN